ncbi:hypothetical protein NQ176_g8336 [Zarea fungicola]|uniref:Uncharacterized protein n=1 Tax=Zarea fungicola TaxID=93591 RepID=A0ACC1MV49_9HYPO|nr:hypothetical protein NQ176_g8336 [Lecanicillium fungicola]
MAGGITYNGIAVVNGGQIFDGLKFWVAQRVPTRGTIVDHIQTNSGTVVLLEKQADYLIADHARKDAPSGAISWKFITESVENGVVQIPDRYKIAQAPTGPRHASSSRPTRGSRTAFTAQEDEILASWVLAHGKHKTGNEIYMEFGEMYPSHPWQSWRNRYVKKLSLLPHDVFLQMAARAANPSALQITDTGSQDQELPDPTALMLQRKGQRVQKETALQRNQERSQHVERNLAALPEPPTLPTSRAQLVQQQKEVEEADIAATTARNQFHEDLQWFSEENGIEIMLTQQIAGQPVALWELSKAVSEQNLPAEEIDWLLVAEDLGYNWLDVEAAVNALQRCYEENLAEFLAVMQDAFDDQPEEPGAAEAEGADREMAPWSRTRF